MNLDETAKERTERKKGMRFEQNHGGRGISASGQRQDAASTLIQRDLPSSPESIKKSGFTL
jgi:hypothetical protein